MDVRLNVKKDGETLIATVTDLNGEVLAKRRATMAPKSMAEKRRMDHFNAHNMGPIARLRGVIGRLCRDKGWNIV